MHSLRPIQTAGQSQLAQTSLVVSGGFFVSSYVSIAFNDDFDWTAESLFAHCALHEIGHSIGLAHSHVEALVMWPTPPNYNAFHPLHPDDVMGIHKIYG